MVEFGNNYLMELIKMQKNSEYRPSFDALAIMKKAVKRETRRHKALAMTTPESTLKILTYAEKVQG